MNWYRILLSQNMGSQDTQQEINVPEYDSGDQWAERDDFVQGHEIGSIMWAWNGSRILTKEVPPVDINNPLDKHNRSHTYVPEFAGLMKYRGRYIPKTGICFIYTAGVGYKVPSLMVRQLERAFPGCQIKFY